MTRVDTPRTPRAWRPGGVLASRRQVLAGTLGVAALAGACTGPPPAPPPPDPLIALHTAALADAALADAVAAAHPPLASAAAALAADRRAHAESLGAEVTRATPSGGPSTTSDPVAPAVPPDRAAASAALVEALRAAQAQATGLVAGLPRYRAGLVASVAACCASHQAVLG
jgi:hypothetical protein